MQDTALATAPTPASMSTKLATCKNDLPSTTDLTTLISNLDTPKNLLYATYPAADTLSYLAWIETTRCGLSLQCRLHAGR
jgi:hypothetical protein